MYAQDDLTEELKGYATMELAERTLFNELLHDYKWNYLGTSVGDDIHDYYDCLDA